MIGHKKAQNSQKLSTSKSLRVTYSSAFLFSCLLAPLRGNNSSHFKLLACHAGAAQRIDDFRSFACSNLNNPSLPHLAHFDLPCLCKVPG